MIGKTILHFKILAKLGEGGMGVVYKAEDTKIKREVAIKFLPRQIAASDEERERFKIEAQAAGALNHNNIATIHAIEEVDDETFIVMEYIKGQELKDKIDTGPLPIDDTLNIAIQIAKGLQAAHTKDVIHRDIKSANIILTDDGDVKIMDFGLAKRGGETKLTKGGTTLGTVAYMSPEQTRGDDVDQRSDIFSSGVLLYEMLTGQLPFKGDYDQAVTYSILNEEPEPMTGLRTGIPMELERIVNKCLNKDASDRYQRADELIVDLRQIKAGSSQSRAPIMSVGADQAQKKIWLWPTFILGFLILVIALYLTNNSNTNELVTQRIMLAVLPFQNLGLPEDEYFADGITGEIISRLSGLSGLSVIARKSAMQYKKTPKSLQQIGEELNIDYVLEGTLQWAENAQGGKRIRLNPELIKIADETQVWSKPYEADFSNVFKLQAEIAATIAQALNITLVKSEQQSLFGEFTNNSEAYDTYLRAGEYAKDLNDEKRLRIAEQLYKKSISLDSNFAAAYARLSTLQTDMHWRYFERSEENLIQSKANAEKALALDPNLSDAHVAMGFYYYHGKLDYEPALREFNAAIGLQPNNADAYAGIGFVLRRQGKMRQALASLEKAFDLDPRNFEIGFFGVGGTLYVLREYDQAIKVFDKFILLVPESHFTYFYKAWAYLLKIGGTNQARATISAALEGKIGIGTPQLKYVLARCKVLDGNLTAALEEISGIGNLDNQFMFKPEDLLIAQIYGLMKNESMAHRKYDSARQMLEKEIKTHPEDSRFYSSLGLAYAGLGRKADAIREGKRGLALLPISKEAWRGSYRLYDLAQIYATVGEPDLALDALDELLGKPTDAISVALLKVDPTWAPLRVHPRFQELSAKYSGDE